MKLERGARKRFLKLPDTVPFPALPRAFVAPEDALKLADPGARGHGQSFGNPKQQCQADSSVLKV